MAYIIGLLKPEEKEELERRGWKVEPPHGDFKTLSTNNMQYGMVYIDNSMLQIMSGNDWDKGPPKTAEVTIRDIQVTERKVKIPTRCPACKADLYSKTNESVIVWEYSDQQRVGHIQRDGDEDDINSVDGLNVAESDLEGGNNLINTKGIYCKCGYILAEGKFEVIEHKEDGNFVIEVMDKGCTTWRFYTSLNDNEQAQRLMQNSIDSDQYSGVRMLLKDIKDNTATMTILHSWPLPFNMPLQPPPNTKKKNAKKRTS